MWGWGGPGALTGGGFRVGGEGASAAGAGGTLSQAPVQRRPRRQQLDRPGRALHFRGPPGWLAVGCREAQGTAGGLRLPQGGLCGRPLHLRCYERTPGSGRGWMILRQPEDALRRAARDCRQGPAFERVRKPWQVVGHRVARLVQRGLRWARRRGRHRTNFQVLIAAAVADLLAGQPDPAAPHPGRVEAAENTPPLPCWGSTGRPRPPWRCLSPSGTSSAARLPRRWPITRLAFATVTSRPRCWAAQVGTLMACNIVQGVHGSRWAPRSSKSMGGASGVLGGIVPLASRQFKCVHFGR